MKPFHMEAQLIIPAILLLSIGMEKSNPPLPRFYTVDAHQFGSDLSFSSVLSAAMMVIPAPRPLHE